MRKKSAVPDDATTAQRGGARSRRKDLAAALRAQETDDMAAAIDQVLTVLEACHVILRALTREDAAEFFRGQERLMTQILAATKPALKSMQDIVFAIKQLRQVAVRADLEGYATEAVMAGTQWLTAAEIGRLFKPNDVYARATVNLWQANGRLFGIQHRGKRLYPAYAFDSNWCPLPAVKEILFVLREFSSFKIAVWFESSSSALNGERPRQVIARDPDAVLAAAKSHLVGPIHG